MSSLHLHIGELQRNARQLEAELEDVTDYTPDDRHDAARALGAVVEALEDARDLLLDVPREDSEP